MMYKKMLEDINNLVQTDFCVDMDFKQLEGQAEYTQEEALKMANIIGRVYGIAHSINCSCGGKYKKHFLNKLINK